MRRNLIDWEARHGYKARYVAKRLGITEQKYSRIKTGKTKPDVDVLERFHKNFQMSYDDVIRLLEEEKG